MGGIKSRERFGVLFYCPGAVSYQGLSSRVSLATRDLSQRRHRFLTSFEMT
jgi:hypothetical protein